jgi:hypothetical protein
MLRQKRLLQQIDMFRDQAMVQQRQIRVAGDEQHLDTGPDAGQLRRQLRPIQLRHYHIGERKIDVACVAGGESQNQHVTNVCATLKEKPRN